MLHLKISHSALADIEDGMAWYNSQQKGLGNKFEELVDATFQRIQKFPLSASFAYDTVRYKVMKQFPYMILYESDETNIYILRIFNVRQEPL